MKKSLIIIYRVSCLLVAVLCFGCFNSKSDFNAESNSSFENTTFKSDSILKSIAEESSVDSLMNIRLNNIEDQIAFLEAYSSQNTNQIKFMRDSLKAFYQLNISGDSSDKDIINSLIRIQSKLNIIEDKIFYSDSIYFNLLYD